MPLIDDVWTDSNFVAGELCLDFSNTLSGRRKGNLKERLQSYDILVGWFVAACVLDDAEGSRLISREKSPANFEADYLESGKLLREHIFSIFDAVQASRQPHSINVDAITRLCIESAPLRTISETGDTFNWVWRPDCDPSKKALGSIALSAVELLTSTRIQMVKNCHAENCAWLFVDETKNHSRTWCDMAVCGNRAKARKHAGKRAQ